MEKAREFQKNIYFCFIDYAKAFDCVDHIHALEKEMATHSSVLAWRIPGVEEPSGLPSMGSHRIGTVHAACSPASSDHASLLSGLPVGHTFQDVWL